MSTFDSRVARGVSVADAAELLSGLLFINLSNDDSHLFLNPRAKHQLMKNHAEQIFDFTLPSDLVIDGFAHDDY